MDRITTFATRLKEYREQFSLTLAEISARTGVPAQTLNRYELSQRIPKIDTANEIAEKLSINSLWLQGYDVPIDVFGEPAETDGLSESVIQLIEVAKTLSDEEASALLLALKAIRK